jgi:hypothetical protein
MRARLLIMVIGVVAVLALLRVSTTTSEAALTTQSRHERYQGKTAREWHAWYRYRTRQLQHARRLVRVSWHPTVDYAIRLASAASGVPASDMRNVARCESGFDPHATNGRYRGLFQLGWSPFGFSPFDPVANALSAALTVRHDGGWRQWECKP